jgi:hypothetical protein
MKYGYCINHPTRYAVNAKCLCAECTKERHKKSAESKGFTIKEKDNGFDITRGRATELRGIQEPYGFDTGQQGEIRQTQKVAFKKTKIKPVSKEKQDEISRLGNIKRQKIEVHGKTCEMCGKHGEVDLFHIIGVGDKKHSTNPVNLTLACRWCHLIWGANDWSKIVKFKNFDEIMERLKSLDEGKYWKLWHKIEKYKNENAN